MSLSSRSDITLPMQDSPQPPLSDEGGGGIENKGYSPPREEKVAETINSELFNNMTIVNMIPTKPTPAFGPYEQMDDYFIPVNQHKKFLRRSEKLYVTKDKRKKSGGGWRRAFCWALALFFFLGLATVALLIALGILNFPLGNKEPSEQWPFGSSSSSSTPEDFVTSTTPFLPPPISPDPTSTYITNSADLEFYIDNKKFEAALSNRSSDAFKELAHQLEHLVNDMLKDKLGVDGVVSRVSEFRPGSVYVKMRVGWISDSPTLEMGPILASVTNLDEYEIRLMKSYGVVNLCKFNKNGCSHICTFDMQVLSFVCACPEPMMISEDAKTCLEDGSTTSQPPTPEEEVSPEEATPTSTTTTTEVPHTEEATTITTTETTTTSTTTPKAEEMATTTPIPETTPTSTTTTTQKLEEHPEGEEEVTTPTTTMSTTPSTTTTTTTEAPQTEEEPEVTTTTENLEENEGANEETTMRPPPAAEDNQKEQQEDNKEEESVTEEVAGEIETETSAPTEGESSTEEPSPLM